MSGPTRRQLAGLALLPLLGGAAKMPLAAEPISRMDTRWWRERHVAKLAEIKGKQVDLVWLGDSITQNWETAGPQPWENFRPIWDHYYGNRHAVNLGFKGDATSHLLWRMDHGEIDGIAPKATVILIGANNLGLVHWPTADNVQGIATVVATVQKKLPQTKILLLGILPSIRGAWQTQTTVEVNQALAARYGHGAVPGVTYMDVGNLFMRDGKIDRAAFLDPMLTPPDPPLHPTAATQARIAAAIEPSLAAMMGDAPRPPV